MPWGKVDDSMYDHPKVELLADQVGDVPASWKVVGAGVLLLAISWCNRQLTDGHITLRTIAKLADLTVDEAELVTDALLEVGLLERNGAPNGFQIHDFLEYSKSKEQVLHERAVKTENGRRGGLVRGEQITASAAERRRGKDEPRSIASVLGVVSKQNAGTLPAQSKHGASGSTSTVPAKSKRTAKQNASTRGLAPVPSRPESRPSLVSQEVSTPGARDEGNAQPGDASVKRGVVTLEQERDARIERAKAKLADPDASHELKAAARTSLSRLGVDDDALWGTPSSEETTS